ncbi:hypothetical protein D9615_006572 [Tricholomella constricta]|uniref:Lectin n=1 Tax=Tricholomella constricta TaxID=117010 RepID=A0A8H5M2Z9_9AGAR|nr:hypothetical protein D9615_006572 [Tricholomella constricta]
MEGSSTQRLAIESRVFDTSYPKNKDPMEGIGQSQSIKANKARNLWFYWQANSFRFSSLNERDVQRQGISRRYDCLTDFSLAILYFLIATCATCVAGLDFTGANWIWTPGRAADGVTYPLGNVTFRRDFTPPAGRVPIAANILITTDNVYTLYVNGRKVGTGTDFRYPQRYCVPLVKDCNVFAVSAQNTGNAAGLLAAIQIRYSDGFTDTIVTDGQWHAIAGTPAGFEQVAFDDSAWPAAFVEGPYPNTAPWTQSEHPLHIPPESQNPGPSLQSANWIWTNELTSPGASVPIGARAFRKTVVLPNGQLTSQARILIATDNEHTVYVNGLLVGSGGSFTQAQRYVVNFPPTSRVVIAVFARNIPPGGPAGVFAAAELVSCDCSEDVYFVTDRSWKYSITFTPNFIQPDFNDAAWLPAVLEGGFGAPPWGPTTVPANNSPQSAALPGAPAAPPASVVA